MAQTALDAAHAAGATYADVRLTVTTSRVFQNLYETETLGMSVRALRDGYWGWAATPYVAATEAPRLGRLAVRLANANAASGLPRTVDWRPIPIVPNGTWTTPIAIDPFEVALEEILDWCAGVETFTLALANSRGGRSAQNPIRLIFTKQERLLLSTEGSCLHQQVYTVVPKIPVAYKGVRRELHLGGPAQAGWEFVFHAPVRELIRRTMDEIDQTVPLPAKALDVGRYDLVCPASVVAALLEGTFGAATQVDRALGYEANAEGTSYLGPDPLRCLGTTVAAPLLTVTAERTTPRALATIKWDDEGVEPAPFPLITHGVLTDYQTTREAAAWLAPWYQKQGTPVRSHGCLASEDALTLPMPHTPNLIMHPGAHALDLETLVQGVDHGYVVDTIDLDMDFQQLNGLGRVTLTEIRRGRRVGQVRGEAGLLLHTPELWQHLQAVGGEGSQDWSVGTSVKGEPAEQVPYSLQTVPALFTQQAIIDPRSKG